MQKDVVLEKKKQSRSPITWVPTAYFAMGLPFVVLNMVTVLMFEGLGVDKTLITFWTSLILLPYTLKPLWSPFLELFKTKKFWVVLTQMVSGVTFGLVAFSLGLPNFFTIAIALLAVIGFSGATHDIACDGVYMSELDEGRKQYLLTCMKEKQTFVTSCDDTDFLKTDGEVYRMDGGVLNRV